MSIRHVDLLSTSRATDAGYLAAADVSSIGTELEVPYRLVGGNAVSMLSAVYPITGVPDRDTADADLGAPYEVVADSRLVPALRAMGYAATAGNRFERTHVPAKGDALTLAVDVLAPSHGATMITNRAHGDLVVDEIPGLSLALARDPIIVDVDVSLYTGGQLTTRLPLPDPVSALCMKAMAYRGRFEPRDALDVWRLLEVAYAAGVRAADWPPSGTGLDASRILYQWFADERRNPMRDLPVGREAQLRVRLLTQQVVLPPRR